ncbi:MAG: hypothetical protein QOJ65_410 [Fimbriimonadaceae bacterium]|jgi:DNA-binding transcriptional ArsR family regulator|nr:hypothetical protein [Fimbriimonadaceae bacterium]
MLDRVFHALSDSTRRGILEMLSCGKCTTGTLVEAFPWISRVAVMKHLDVLESAGLISVSRSGRERWNEIDVDTLQEAETWIAQHFVAMPSGRIAMRQVRLQASV